VRRRRTGRVCQNDVLIKLCSRLPDQVERQLKATLTEKFKTDLRMPPQFGPLESQAADNPRGRDEKGIGLPIETGTGGRTNWNRAPLDAPRAHATDAACVQALTAWRRPILSIKATCRGAYQRTRLDRFGCPRDTLIRAKRVAGFQTGDMVRAVIRDARRRGYMLAGLQSEPAKVSIPRLPKVACRASTQSTASDSHAATAMAAHARTLFRPRFSSPG